MTLVLVDSSVWINFLRARNTQAGLMIREMMAEKAICTNGIIVNELLFGARHEKDVHTLKNLLEPLPFLQTTEPVWWRAGEIRLQMKNKGFSASLPDAVIAATALHHGAALFTLDTHFHEIARFVPLKLIRI